MPLEELGEVGFRFLGRAFIWLFVEVIFEIGFYFLGRLILFLITLGRYKPSKKEDGKFESFIGLVSFLIAVVIYLAVTQ